MMFLLNLQNTNIVESTQHYTSSELCYCSCCASPEIEEREERFVHSTYGCNSKVPRDLK